MHTPRTTKQLGVFAVWCWFSPSYTMSCALSVFALRLEHDPWFAFVKARTDWERLGPGLHFKKQEPSSLRNHLEFQGCTWSVPLSSLDKSFNIPIRVTEIVQCVIPQTMAVTKTNSQLKRSWYTLRMHSGSVEKWLVKMWKKQWAPDHCYNMKKNI